MLGQVRTVLDEELGLEPSAELRGLQTAVLRQDPTLEWRPHRPGGSRDLVGALPGRWSVARRSLLRSPLSSTPRPRRSPRSSASPASARPAWSPSSPSGPGSRTCGCCWAAARRTRARPRCGPGPGCCPVSDRSCPRPGPVPPGRTRAPASAPGTPWSPGWSTPPTTSHCSWCSRTCTGRTSPRCACSGCSPRPPRRAVCWSWPPGATSPSRRGALADVVESFARRHAVRVDAHRARRRAGARPSSAPSPPGPRHGGRRPSYGSAPTATRSSSWSTPDSRGEADLDTLLGEPDPPAAVNDVLVRRLDRLPERTGRVLRIAAVLGRCFRLDTVAVALGADEDDVLDDLEPSLAAGLVRDDGVDRFRFAHALVRDALAPGPVRVPAGPAAPAGRARRWRRPRVARPRSPGTGWPPGRPHAGVAWRAARAAADLTRRLHAHEETAALLEQALGAVEDDPAAGPRDRYGLLMDLVDAYRWSGHWQGLTTAAEKAVAAARAVDDQPELVAQAAVSATVGALWQSAPHGEVNEGIVAALRASLDRMPTRDDPLRCRTMLGLANELYYGSTFEERRALVEEALAMARRLDEPALLLDACQIAFVALWCPRTGEDRLRYIEEAVTLARASRGRPGIRGRLDAAHRGRRRARPPRGDVALDGDRPGPGGGDAAALRPAGPRQPRDAVARAGRTVRRVRPDPRAHRRRSSRRCRSSRARTPRPGP